jgi:enterochelin esterase-like enzyme
MRVDDVDRFLAEHRLPIVDGSACTFVFRGQADGVRLVQRVTGETGRVPMRRVDGTDLWYAVLHVREGSRLNYQFEVRHGERVECVNDPLNPQRSRSPIGDSSVLYAQGYVTPQWTLPADGVPRGELRELVVPSRALDRNCDVTLYVPHGDAKRPLLIVHDGGDFLEYAAARAVLDNLIHRGDMAPVVVAFLHPKDRLVEYTDSAAHARFLTKELVPRLEGSLPLDGRRCLLGSSFGAVASLSAAYRYPRAYGSLILLSGSFVFTEGTADHGSGPAFGPVVRFVNRYRRRPRRVAERIHLSCGVYEPLIFRNRAMLPVFRSTGMDVRYVEALDGHTWENWRDRLRDALSWTFPRQL